MSKPLSARIEPLWTRASSRESLTVAVGVLFAAVWLTFHALVGFDFVNWDDGLHVYNNAYLNSFNIGEISHFWAKPYGHLYVPLSYTLFATLSLAAERNPGDLPLSSVSRTLDPHVFHVASLILHMVNVILVFFLLRRLTCKDLPSLLGTLVFAVHPLQVESVAWISELRGLLGAAFSLTAIHLYLMYVALSERRENLTGKFAYLGSLVASVCAMLSKPSSVTIGLIIAIIGIWGCRRNWKKVLKESAPYLPAALVVVVITSHVQNTAGGQVVPILLRPFVAADAVAFYLSKFLVPADLGIDYGRTPVWTVSHWWAYLDWLIPAAIAIAVISVRRSAPYLVFGYLVFISTLLPVLGITPFVYQAISTTADRYTYFALIGAGIIVSYGLSSLTSVRQTTALIIGSVWLAGLAFASYFQSLTWRNSYSLCTHALSVNPNSSVAENNLGVYYDNLHEFADALQHYYRAATINPQSQLYQLNIGVAYAELGQQTAAETQFRHVIAMSPSKEAARRDLGMLLITEKRLGEGSAQLQLAKQIDPNDYLASEWLGDCYAQNDDFTLAAIEFKDAVRDGPQTGVLWRKLGLMLYASHQPTEAVKALQRALQIDPNDILARQTLQSLLDQPMPSSH